MILLHNSYASHFLKDIKYLKRFSSNLTFFDKMPQYNLKTKLQLENFWHDKTLNIKEHNANKKKMYILSMFPYPSGQLHMGHLRVYTTADVLARFYRLTNHHVIFPMGWDAFGLPAENAAFERGLEPHNWTNKNINEMKQQMINQMSLSIDWTRELSTCDPNYYKSTQWLFCRLYENGLVYRKTETVNWDPIDKTVLADELIDNEGRSWRSGAIVEKIPLKQWFIRTTALSESLLEGLDSVKDGQWRHVIEAQKGWIGNLEGVYIDFDLVEYRNGNKLIEKLSIFTENPAAALSDLISFVEICKENIWWNYSDNKLTNLADKLSFHNNLAVRHPISGRLIPIIKNPDLKFHEPECLTSRLGLALINFKDATLAAKLNIPFSYTRLGAYNRIINSAWSESEGMFLDHNLEITLNDKCLQTLRSLGRGGYRCSKMRKDWLISRQRYWGTPIPIIHCPSCGPVLVEDSDLPVILPPYIQCQSNKSNVDKTSPLTNALDWLTVKCPKCGYAEAHRESDTMDTFVDSSWYFLRYLDSSNSTSPCSPSVALEQMPVDIYVGGLEHAIRHLYYARFMSHFIHYYTDIKLPSGPEPFLQFLPIGLVLAQTFQTNLGKYVSSDFVKYSEKKPVHKDTGEPLIEYWDKMSKSKQNGINPKDVVEKYGIDTTRLIILANTGPDRNRKWQENDVVVGIQNWENRIWKLIDETVSSLSIIDPEQFSTHDFILDNDEFIRDYQSNICKILHAYQRTFTISVIVARLQKLTSAILKLSKEKRSKHSVLYHRILLDLLLYLYPLSPLLSAELWGQLSSKIARIEHVFVETDSTYASILGPWHYNLNLPIWEQELNLDVSESNEANVTLHNVNE